MRKRKGPGNGTLMIRMIDVVFILLFGFIAVSQIGRAEGIVPPKSDEALMPSPEGSNILVINVKTENRYSVGNGEIVFTDIASLRKYIDRAAREARESEKEFRVRIRANWDVSIESCMRVAKVCRDLGYAKGLDVVKANR